MHLQLLKGHTDEVWHVQFSHLGDRLASASKDKTAIIWVVSASGEAKMQHVLKGHPDHVTHLTWSKDDSKMLTCSSVSVCCSHIPTTAQKADQPLSLVVRKSQRPSQAKD